LLSKSQGQLDSNYQLNWYCSYQKHNTCHTSLGLFRTRPLRYKSLKGHWMLLFFHFGSQKGVDSTFCQYLSVLLQVFTDNWGFFLLCDTLSIVKVSEFVGIQMRYTYCCLNPITNRNSFSLKCKNKSVDIIRKGSLIKLEIFLVSRITLPN
jgi:hypothetical protein